MVSRHNKLRDVFYDFCQRACLCPRLEMGCGAGSDSQSRSADVLVPNWDLGKPAAFDLSVTSTLQSSALLEASVTAGSAAQLENITTATKSVTNWGGPASLLWLRPTGVGELKQWQHYQSLQDVSLSGVMN